MVKFQPLKLINFLLFSSFLKGLHLDTALYESSLVCLGRVYTIFGRGLEGALALKLGRDLECYKLGLSLA